MTALAIASITGALLFFAGGVAIASLWTRRLAVPEAIVDDAARIHAATAELESTRERAQLAESAIDRLRAELEAARARTERVEAELEQARFVPVANRPDEVEHLRRELASARALHQQARTTTDDLSARLAVDAARVADAEARGQRLAAELERARAISAAADARAKQLAADLDKADTRAKRIATELEQARAAAKKLETELDRARSASVTTEKQLASELDRARNASVAAGKDAEQLDDRVREIERQLAERQQAVRDLAGENEQLKGRLADAEALRAEYVRLRTTVTETAYLKAEVARLEEQIRALRRDSLGAKPPRPTRADSKLGESPVRPTGSIGESLSTTLDRFADSHTRATAVADTLGFPLASSGEDGNALAAYAALLFESANKASQLLPMSPPSAIELLDDRGARINLWTFGVERERVMLVNLAVAPVDQARVQSTLSELSSILAPTLAEAPTVLEGPTLVEGTR